MWLIILITIRKNNLINNLQLLSLKENSQKSNNKKIAAINFETEKEKNYESLSIAAK